MRDHRRQDRRVHRPGVGGFSALLLWVGFLLTLTRLAANSFSPFLYFQF